MPAPQPSSEPGGTLVAAESSRRPDIQGLRAIAVLTVVAFHAGLPVPGGFIGVDVFFVISGFVITAMLQREWQQTGQIRLRHFYLRRFKRLTPALAVTTATTMVVGAFVLSPLGAQQTAAKTGIGAMLLIANFVIARTTGGYFDAPAETNPLLHTWSLSVEEQFYLVFPALIIGGWLLGRRRGVLRFSPFALVASIAVVSFALAVAGSAGFAPQGLGTLLGFYSPFTRAWEFAVGALLALTIATRTFHIRRVSTAVGLIGMALLAASLWLITEATPFPGVWTVLPVTGTLLLLLAGIDSTAASSRLLSSPPMVKIGDWSYSMYLWHWPFIVVAGLLWPKSQSSPLIAAIMSLAPALASYYWVEQPIRSIGQQTAKKTGLLVGVTVGTPVAVALVVGLIASQLWAPRIQAITAEAAKKHAGYTLGCHFGPDDGYRDPEPCEWNAAASGLPVYLLGDSNAAHFVEGLIASTRDLNRPLIVTTSSGCPLLDVSIKNPLNPGYERACPARTARLLEWMQQQRPGTVVLSTSDVYWLSTDYTVLDQDGQPAANPESRVRLMETSLARTVTQLERSGHNVVIVQSVPHFFGDYSWDPASCTLMALLAGCVHEMPLEATLARSSEVRSAVLAAGESTGARVLDLADLICPDGECLSQRDGMPIYRDADHITVAMSVALAPLFGDVLTQVSAAGVPSPVRVP